MKVKIIKNVLNQDQLDLIKSYIISNRFPWFYVKSNQGDVDGKFIHSFYDNHECTSPYGEVIDPILNKVQGVEALIKIQAVLLSRVEDVKKDKIKIKNKLLKNQFVLIYALDRITFNINHHIQDHLNENEMVIFRAQEECDVYYPKDAKKNIFIIINFII